MAGHSFRFLQAGSFQLQRALQGLPDVPDHLGELLVDAPFLSAAEVFAAAVREEVDFLVLTGDLFDPTMAGPRAVAFLQAQFEQLAEREIVVYWAASRLDLTANWLAAIDWPGNVRVFDSDEMDEFQHQRGDEVLARILGRSWHEQRPPRVTELTTGPADQFSIAVLPGEQLVDDSATAVAYWAFGCGKLATPVETETFAHAAGPPLGFSPQERCAGGCTLVQVSPEGEIRTRRLETDAVRWYDEQVAVGNSVSRPEIRAALKARIKHLISAAKRPLLVRWTITGEDRFDTLLNDEPSRIELLEWLRDQFGQGAHPAWSVSIELQPPDVLPQQWIEEDSILGDFLRVAKSYQDQPEQGLGLEQFVLDCEVPPELDAVMHLKDGMTRNQVLREAAILGADLLRGDESEVA